jgi:hypothetical protein
MLRMLVDRAGRAGRAARKAGDLTDAEAAVLGLLRRLAKEPHRKAS